MEELKELGSFIVWIKDAIKFMAELPAMAAQWFVDLLSGVPTWPTPGILAMVLTIASVGLWSTKVFGENGVAKRLGNSTLALIFKAFFIYFLVGGSFKIMKAGLTQATIFMVITGFICLQKEDRQKIGGYLSKVWHALRWGGSKGLALAVIGGRKARDMGRAGIRLLDSPLKEHLDEALNKLHTTYLYDHAAFEMNAKDLEEKLGELLPGSVDEIAAIVKEFKRENGIEVRQETALERAFQRELEL